MTNKGCYTAQAVLFSWCKVSDNNKKNMKNLYTTTQNPYTSDNGK
jgi:hypothetical protein